MASNSEISASFLTKRSDAANFLNNRRRFTRLLGKDVSRESGLVQAAEDPNRDHKSFRGINFLNPSPFGTRPLKDFRGVVKGDYDGFVNPETHINDGAIDNRYQAAPPSLEALRTDLREAEKIDYGEDSGWIYLKQHPKVGEMLAEDESLREGYFDSEPDEDYDLNSQMTGLAEQRLGYDAEMNRSELEKDVDTAKMMALNLGGAADTLAGDSELAEAVTGDPREGYSEDIREEFAVKTAAKFEEETGLDEEFFREHPEAAVFLDRRPGMVDMLNQRPEDAEDFKRYFGQMQGQAREEARAEAASALSGEGQFVEDYLESDPEFAVDAAVDMRLKTGDSLVDNTILHSELEDKTAFINEVYEGHISARAADSLGEGHDFDREYFKERPGLAHGVQRSEALAGGLRESAAEAERFFGEPGGEADLRSDVRGAMLAYSGGYPLRSSVLIDLWL